MLDILPQLLHSGTVNSVVHIGSGTIPAYAGRCWLKSDFLSLLATVSVLSAGCATVKPESPVAVWRPRDLSPVSWRKAPAHAPVEIVQDGEPRAVVFVTDAEPGRELDLMVKELIEVVRLSTGATLEQVAKPPARDQVAIIIGDCDETRKAGIDAAKIPVEGFVVKTAAKRVYLVGSTMALPPGSNEWAYWRNAGTAWAVADFLECFVDVRWYWPTAVGGRTITRRDTLTVPAVHYSDEPAFRMREYHPWNGWKLPTTVTSSDKVPLPFAPGAIPDGVHAIDMASYLPLVRGGSSWPYKIKCHEPQNLQGLPKEYLEQNADMFALKEDGTRNFRMFCYSSQKALERIRIWRKKSSTPITTWDYCVSWSSGAYQYPHVVRDFHKQIKGLVAGTFVNGWTLGEWTMTAPTHYVWMKALWNPELDVDAIFDRTGR